MNSSLIGKACNSNDRYALIFFTLLGSRCLATMQTYGDIMQIPTHNLACNLIKKLDNDITYTYPICTLSIIDRELNKKIYRYLVDTSITNDDVRIFVRDVLFHLEDIYLCKARVSAAPKSNIATRYKYQAVKLEDLSNRHIKQLTIHSLPPFMPSVIEVIKDIIELQKR